MYWGWFAFSLNYQNWQFTLSILDDSKCYSLSHGSPGKTDNLLGSPKWINLKKKKEHFLPFLILFDITKEQSGNQIRGSQSLFNGGKHSNVFLSGSWTTCAVMHLSVIIEQVPSKHSGKSNSARLWMGGSLAMVLLLAISDQAQEWLTEGQLQHDTAVFNICWGCWGRGWFWVMGGWAYVYHKPVCTRLSAQDISHFCWTQILGSVES